MRRESLGEEIAVLDGLEGLALVSPNDGRIGRRPATGAEYALRKRHNYETRRNVIDASEGANYSGGSSYAPGLPLMPSSVGLAALADEDLVNYSKVTNVLPPRRNVIDASGGANYSGGSSYAPGLPLLPSGDPGLADLMEAARLMDGGYGSAGMGGANWAPGGDGGYGSDGMGYWEETYRDFDGYDISTIDQHVGSSMTIEGLGLTSPNDGRIGRRPATGAEYALRKRHNYETRRNVIDASEGSSYAPGLPLMPSSVGLAGLDGLDDLAFFKRLAASQKQAFKRLAGKRVLNRKKRWFAKIRRAIPAMTPLRRQAAVQKLRVLDAQIAQIRKIRAGVAKELMQRRGMLPRVA
jgi:hypothetical protein